jgi:hypothetical protein
MSFLFHNQASLRFIKIFMIVKESERERKTEKDRERQRKTGKERER